MSEAIVKLDSTGAAAATREFRVVNETDVFGNASLGTG